MIGTAIGAGLKVAGSIFGGIAAARAARNQRKVYTSQINANNNYLSRKLNEDATQRADAQAAITQMTDALKSQNRRQAGINAVMGGSSEAVAAQKQAASSAIGNTYANINAAAVGEKNALEQNVRSQNAALNDKIANTYGAQAQAVQNASQGMSNTSTSWLDTLIGKSK